MSRTIFFLGGDAYPMDRAIEETLRERLSDEDCRFVSHSEIHRGFPDGQPIATATRLRLLENAVGSLGEREEIFLIGRSSGGRIATLFAAGDPRISAVVCICYPFRFPNRRLEPERFVHLATLATPTLIVQGASDDYGGIDLTEHYALSEAIRLRIVPGGHELPPDTPGGRYVLRHVPAFIAGDWREGGQSLAGFDEEFYLKTNPDVADAVTKGACPSGLYHFEVYGRREGRKYRLQVEAV